MRDSVRAEQQDRPPGLAQGGGQRPEVTGLNRAFLIWVFLMRVILLRAARIRDFLV